ncbi:MAG: hypothetical protein FWH06_06065, partial [Oscillospiraceae bacterium]|nr:hypothetical protein [Oscillospiraceae bacterium]
TLEYGGSRFRAIGFGFSDFPFHAGDRVDAAFSLGINTFRGRRDVQLELRDIRSSARISERYALETGLYERFINNEKCVDERLLPLTRDDLASVWRYLSRAADTLCQIRTPAHTLIGGISARNPRVGMARLLASLDVLSELGLLTYRRDGDAFDIGLRGGGVKVDLMDSALLRRLSGSAV